MSMIYSAVTSPIRYARENPISTILGISTIAAGIVIGNIALERIKR